MSHYLKKELYELIKTDESIFDFIQDSSLDGLWYWDLENPENEWMNPKFWTVLGYNPDEMPHKASAWQNIINQDDLQLAAENFTKHCENPNHPYDQVVRYRHKNGSTVWIRCRGLAIRDENRKPIRMLGVHQDITDIKISEERLQSLFRDVETVSIQGYAQDGTVLYWNKASTLLYGYTEQEAVGSNLLDLIIPSEMCAAVTNEIQRMYKTRQPIPASELTLRHKDGSPVTVFSSHSFVEIPGQETEFFCIDIDLSERKLAEQQIIAAKEKAEEANRLKTEFINNMSHEIRTPMNGIIGFSGMLDNPDLSYEKRTNYSKIVKNSSFQLLKIIDDILAISTLETKQEKIYEREFCLNDLLMELYSIFNLNSKERKVPIYLKKELHDKQSYILSDKTKLHKILSNLIENALKFTHEGYIEFGYFIENEFLKLYVKDTGIGVSPKNHEIIFERFSQEDKDISINHGGLGLGLSISKENAQLLGGDITLESEKGKGATFFVTIPYKPVNNDEISLDNTLEDKTYTILVAEDEEINYFYIEALFEDVIERNYNIIHAKNGKDAVDICLGNSNINLVLMDIKMPIMNGLEATEIIKSKFPKLPIIAQTAYSKESDKELALKHGCDDFISKPIDKEKLFEMINNCLIYK